jgi:alpha-tubulin suppressor-like RCC1 family protein
MKFSCLVAISVIILVFTGHVNSAFAACSSPTGAAGDIVFNSSGGRIMQTCDGTNWKGWPRAIAGTWRSVRIGTYHVCGIKTDNTLYCWGVNNNGQIGNGTSGTNVLYPAQVSGAWSDVRMQDDPNPGPGQTCGIKIDGSMYCWGSNENLQGGYPTTGSSNVPRAVTFGGTWDSLAVGTYSACAIKAADKTVWCWGKDDQGERGDGGGDGGSSAIAVQESSGASWRLITGGGEYAGSQTFCGIKADDTGWCWGNNDNGQVGDNTSGTARFSPTALSVTGVTTWKTISSGDPVACGIKTDGTLWCWGSNEFGTTGNGVVGGAGAKTKLPTAVSTTGVTTWKSVSAGSYTACGIKTDDTGWCWGYGNEGNIGDGAPTNRGNPYEFLPGAKWKMINAGSWPACGIMLNGTLWCWGENEYGGQGIGHTNQTNIPNYVVGSAVTACSSPTGAQGDLLFNSASRVLQWCDGAQWNTAGPISPTGPLAGCTSPTGVMGDILFNSASAKHQYCDGDAWRGITW